MQRAEEIEEKDMNPVDLKQGVFQVKGAGLWYNVQFGSDTSPPSCSCQAFTKTHIPCKHFFGVFLHFSEWSWSKLPSTNLNGPYLSLDNAAIKIMLGEDCATGEVADSNPSVISEDSLAQGPQEPQDSGHIYADAIPKRKVHLLYC